MRWWWFIGLTSLYYVVLSVFTLRRQRLQERIAYVGLREQAPVDPTARRLAAKQLLRKLAKGWAKNQSNSAVERMQRRLLSAGSPGGLSVAEWIGLRFVTTGLCACFGLVLLFVTKGLAGMAALLGGTLLGWIGPDFWLSRKITFRQAQILRQLPSALDLLTVSVEAGLGFDQAIHRVSTKLKGPLSVEFERVLKEVQLGSARSAALQRLSARCGVNAVRTFVSAVIQSERLGVGLAQVLRIQSEEVRRNRRMDAEERAMKAPVKMLFPLILFVFPALFIIILGPAVLHMLAFFKGGN